MVFSVEQYSKVSSYGIGLYHYLSDTTTFIGPMIEIRSKIEIQQRTNSKYREWYWYCMK